MVGARGRGRRQLPLAPIYVPVANPNRVTLGDLNGDGKLDVVVPTGDGVAAFLNGTP